MKSKLKNLKYNDKTDVGLEAAIFQRKRYSSRLKFFRFENNGIIGFSLSYEIVILIAESLVVFIKRLLTK